MTPPREDRRPRAFSLDDPALVMPPTKPDGETTAADGDQAHTPAASGWAVPAAADIAAGIRWGQVLVSAAIGLALLAAGLWFARFVAIALARDDLIGWTAWALALLMGLAALVLGVRESLGLLRLQRLGSLRHDVEGALRDKDLSRERRAVDRLAQLLSHRDELKWGQARLREHMGDVRDPGDLARLAERELLAPLDAQARAVILHSAKRISMVTAISPMAWLAMLFVLIENLRLLRAIATIYGGRPGLIGGLRLARMVIAHIVASGGIAMTEDLVGQFLGQDLLRRVSRRLGEGAFNGALTARIGVAALEVIRPMPHVETAPIRLRDLVGELLRRRKPAADANPRLT